MANSLNTFFSFNKNDTLTNILIFLVLAITIGYLTQKRYEAVVFLYIIAVLLFFLSKNVALSLGLSIVFTNLLITLNFFQVTENFEGKHDKEKKKELERLNNISNTKKVKKVKKE